MILLIQCILICAVFTLRSFRRCSKIHYQIVSIRRPFEKGGKHAAIQGCYCRNCEQKHNAENSRDGCCSGSDCRTGLSFRKNSFSSAFVHVFILFSAVNVYDLIVLDLFVFAHCKKVIIPGTEDMIMEYRDPVHHIKGALKGLIISLCRCRPRAGIVEIAAKYIYIYRSKAYNDYHSKLNT